MGINTDEEPKSSIGPSRWRRVYSAMVGFFNSGPSTYIISVAAGGQATGLEASALSAYRAKLQAAEAVAKERLENTKRKRQMLEQSVIQPYLEEKMRLAFHPENYARLFFTKHTSTNVMRRIVNETSKLYENPARRSYKEEELKDVNVTPPNPDQQAQLPATTQPQQDPSKQPQDPGLLPTKETPPTPPQDGATPPGTPQLQTGNPDVDRLAAVLALTGTPEKEQTPLDKLMEAYDWDSLLDQVEKLCMVCPVVWVRPYVIYEYEDVITNGTSSKKPKQGTGELCYIIYTPECADVVTHPSNPMEMVAWYYFGEEYYQENGQFKKRTVIHYWDDKNYTKFDQHWKVIQGPEADERGINVAEFRVQRPAVNSYYSDGIGDDLYEATLEACLLKTLQNQRFKDGAFKQLAISGQADKTMTDQVMGGPPPIFVGDEGQVTVLDLQADYDQMTNMWKAREEYIAVTYGIDLAEYKGEGHPQSGFAKKLAQGKVLAESKRRRKHFQNGEQALYECTARELKVNPVELVPALDETKKIVTDFAEPTFEEDPQNQATVDAQEIEFNAISVIDVLRRKNPDLTDVELVKLAHRNKEINDVFMTSDQKGLIKLLSTKGTGAGSSLAAQQGRQGGAPPFGGGGDNNVP